MEPSHGSENVIKSDLLNLTLDPTEDDVFNNHTQNPGQAAEDDNEITKGIQYMLSHPPQNVRLTMQGPCEGVDYRRTDLRFAEQHDQHETLQDFRRSLQPSFTRGFSMSTFTPHASSNNPTRPQPSLELPGQQSSSTDYHAPPSPPVNYPPPPQQTPGAEGQHPLVQPFSFFSTPKESTQRAEQIAQSPRPIQRPPIPFLPLYSYSWPLLSAPAPPNYPPPPPPQPTPESNFAPTSSASLPLLSPITTLTPTSSLPPPLLPQEPNEQQPFLPDYSHTFRWGPIPLPSGPPFFQNQLLFVSNQMISSVAGTQSVVECVATTAPTVDDTDSEGSSQTDLSI